MIAPLLGKVHVAPEVSVPVAALIAAALCLYAAQLARSGVPASRRWIRGVSLGLMTLTLGLMLTGLSFVDSAVDKKDYVYTWTLALIALILVLCTAAADFVNSMRLISVELDEEQAALRQRVAERS